MSGYTPPVPRSLAVVVTAGEDLAARDVVYVSADNTVRKAASGNRRAQIGVVKKAAALGEQVEVVYAGRATVISDGVITAGDPVAAGATAGRVVSLLTHSHTNPNTGSGGSHPPHQHQVADITAWASSYTERRIQFLDSYGYTLNANLEIQEVFGYPWVTGSGGEAGTHAHSQGSTGSVNRAEILGKALTGATGAGQSIDILVSLAG